MTAYSSQQLTTLLSLFEANNEDTISLFVHTAAGFIEIYRDLDHESEARLVLTMRMGGL